MKKELKALFKKIYPGRRLLAVQLNGFTHRVIFDGGKKADPVEAESFSHCMPEGPWPATAQRFFAGIGHSLYQNNAQEILFIAPERR